MKRQYRSENEWREIFLDCDKYVRGGGTIAQFCASRTIPPPTYYNALVRARRGGGHRDTSTNGNQPSSVLEALKVLRQAGIRLPRNIAKAARVSVPKLKRHDLANIKRWCADAWQRRERFVVGWSGGHKSAHLVFHTLAGLHHRQAHAETIRHKLADVAPAAPAQG